MNLDFTNCKTKELAAIQNALQKLKQSDNQPYTNNKEEKL